MAACVSACFKAARHRYGPLLIGNHDPRQHSIPRRGAGTHACRVPTQWGRTAPRESRHEHKPESRCHHRKEHPLGHRGQGGAGWYPSGDHPNRNSASRLRWVRYLVRHHDDCGLHALRKRRCQIGVSEVRCRGHRERRLRIGQRVAEHRMRLYDGAVCGLDSRIDLCETIGCVDRRPFGVPEFRGQVAVGSRSHHGHVQCRRRV